MNLSSLELLVAAGESLTLELKKSTAEKDCVCRTLCALAEGVQLGNPLSQLFQQFGVWNKQQPVMQQALKRLPLKKLLVLNQLLLATDKAIKGQSSENAWDNLLRLSLALAGVTLFETAV